MGLPRYSATHPLSQIKYIVAIAAGKGGVGKSSITVNLALALRRLGCRVGIMDTDIYGPSIRKMLPEDRAPMQKGEEIVPAQCKGIKMISMAYFRPENEAAVIRAPIANGLISQFINYVVWGELDFLLIDFPPGTGDIQITLSQQAHLSGAIMVTTPQEVAVMDVRKAIHLFQQVKVPIIGIVENMSYYHPGARSEAVYPFGRGGGTKLAEEMGVPLLGSIPLDPEICKSGDEGRSLFIQEDSNIKPSVTAFMQLAENLMCNIEHIKATNRVPKVVQINPFTISIESNEGKAQNYRLAEIQKSCLCARCIDESTGKRLVDPNSVDPNVQMISMKVVGHYGLQFKFTSGCSTGIYSFDRIRQLRSVAE